MTARRWRSRASGRTGTTGSSSISASPAGRGSASRAGGQDGPHVGGAQPAERDRPVQRGERSLLAVGGAQRVQLGQLGSQPGVTGRGGAGDERLGDRAERAELFLRAVFGRTARRGAGRGPP